MPRIPCVYIMQPTTATARSLPVSASNPSRSAFTNNCEGLGEGFTRRYQCKLLVFYETYDRMERKAIAVGGRIMGGSRARKLALIEAMNPQWRDLYADLA